MRAKRYVWTLLLVIVAGLTGTSGCADQTPAQPCPTTGRRGVAIAVGARANTPAPALPEKVVDIIDDAIASGQNINLIRVDGEPAIHCVMRFQSTAANPVADEDDRRKFRAAVFGAIGLTRARVPQADPLGALTLAAATAGDGGTVVLLDSGLQTVPPLDFGVAGFLDQVLAADPRHITAQLKEDRLLPDLTGRTVVLAGIGYTADPQPDLGDARRADLVALWQRIVAAGNAGTVDEIEQPSSSPAVAGVPEVTVVEVPPTGNLVLRCDTETVLFDAGPVGFRPDEARFVDRDAARRALTAYAAWLSAHPGARVELVGNVAHHGPDRGLSLRRAQAVGEALTGLGVAGDRITARGGGWGPYPTPDAPPEPRYDPLNRRVVIKLVCGG